MRALGLALFAVLAAFPAAGQEPTAAIDLAARCADRDCWPLHVGTEVPAPATPAVAPPGGGDGLPVRIVGGIYRWSAVELRATALRW